MREFLIIPAAFLLIAAGLPDDVPVPSPNPRDTPPAVLSGQDPAATNSETPPPVTPKPAEPDPAPPKPDETALAACEAELKALGAVFERRDAIDGPGTCGLSATYDVTRLAPGIEIRPETEITCRTALAAAHWVRDVVGPAAKVFGKDVRLTGLRQASTYVCRTRNSQPGAKISEHARGTAIDISTFEFDGHGALSVMPEQRKGSREEAFQKAVRAGACLHFTTVLGPGSDAFHDNHLHLDLARRNHGYRLCQ
jgi:hypothetical protein